MCYPLALSVWSDELSGDNLEKFFISSCCQCSLQSSLKPSAENVWLFWFTSKFRSWNQTFLHAWFLFYFLWEWAQLFWTMSGSSLSSQHFFFSKHSDCKSHFLNITYQCMFINCICLSSLSLFEVINCLFSLFFMVCPNPKYLATLHLSFVLVGNTFSCLLQLF